MPTSMTTPFFRFSSFCEEVYEWSYANFGHQESKRCSGIFLGPVAPLLGIIEEIGELSDAMYVLDLGLVEDAIADTMIYLAEYLVRSNLDVLAVIPWKQVVDRLDIECLISSPEKTTAFLCGVVGRLAHLNLKWHQGIREGVRKETYLAALGPVLADVIIGLGRANSAVKIRQSRVDNFVHETHDKKTTLQDILTITFQVWNRVKLRNWKANPKTGVNATK